MSQEFKDMLEQKGCLVVWLSPYSPNYNAIELCFRAIPLPLQGKLFDVRGKVRMSNGGRFLRVGALTLCGWTTVQRERSPPLRSGFSTIPR